MTIAEDAHVKRSQLINEYLQEARAIEKDLKKKKLPAKQKETLEAKLDTLREEHEQRLAEFDEAQGITSAKAAKLTDADKAKTSATDPAVFEERSWGSLSKRELEEECIRRGLTRKGAKEDLVSRLTIFTLDHKAQKARSGEPDDVPLIPAKAPIKYETVIPQGPTTKPDYRNKNKKLWKRRGPPTKSKRTSSSSSSGSDSEAESSDAAPEAAPQGEDPENEERQKQLKREAIIQNVLGSILKKYTKGIPIQEMPEYLERFRVQNFSPAALGYADVEEWISRQPRDVLHVDKKTLLVYPPRVGEMPSSDSESSSKDSEESDD
eukprot:Protomagalhaensia_wolfi_Nauph_80__376@NODE_1208_length_1658_cov_22_457072_g928_i0_p1_GENE_NODE_1208_length_1658_cov_22_457072_g928_i0NODE_1208_length_1658_cov_22_457072_g928_i0_p1_ORF_typecomplete_len322_score67_21SAP/PF02037_27/0_00013SAP/PF02037_27/7_3e03Efg1/PF10153_9/0_007Efg1/PF10153_9/5_3e03LETM1/PF07766_13/0_019OSTHTH/PF12872_7/0_026Chorion_2/PF03964_15/0_023Chorion_2/PF03964_15/2_5e03DUF755/PF05501_11/3_1e03DUF755/PF05501_11/0_031DUF755/PF05501_11/50TEX12/PF15219_6/4_9_NODE_1208_length_1